MDVVLLTTILLYKSSSNNVGLFTINIRLFFELFLVLRCFVDSGYLELSRLTGLELKAGKPFLFNRPFVSGLWVPVGFSDLR
jgi:hypothetical protein